VFPKLTKQTPTISQSNECPSGGPIQPGIPTHVDETRTIFEPEVIIEEKHSISTFDAMEGSLIDLQRTLKQSICHEPCPSLASSEEETTIGDKCDPGVSKMTDIRMFSVSRGALKQRLIYLAKYHVRDPDVQREVYEDFAPLYPLNYFGVTRRNGRVEHLEVERAEMQIRLDVDVAHHLDLNGILAALPFLSNLSTDSLANKLIGVFSLMIILFKNLGDPVTISCTLMSLAAMLGVASKSCQFLSGILSKAYNCLKSRIVRPRRGYENVVEPEPVASTSKEGGIRYRYSEMLKKEKETERAEACIGDDVPEAEEVSTLLKYFKEFEFVKALHYLSGFSFLCIVGLILKKIPGRGTFDEAMLRIRHLPNAVQSASDIAAFGTELSRRTFSAIRKYICGHTEEEFDAMSGVSSWMKDVDEFITLGGSMKIKSDAVSQTKADQLYVRGLHIAQVFDSLRVPFDKQQAFRNYLLAASRLREEAHRSGAGFMIPRTEPLIAMFCGCSGIGKSVLVNAVTADLMKRRGAKTALEVGNLVYYRMIANEYWDGFNSSHKIVVIDDFAAVKDSELNPNPEFAELIHEGNMAPFPVHKACISEKASTFFNAEAVILTTNKVVPHIVSMAYPEAVLRRLEERFIVHIAPEFGRVAREHHDDVIRLNKRKVVMDVSHFLECYRFDLLFPEDRNDPPTEFVRKNMTYEQMITYLLEQDELQQARCHKLLGVIEDYMGVPLEEIKAKAESQSAQVRLEQIGGSVVERAQAMMREGDDVRSVPMRIVEHMQDPRGLRSRQTERVDRVTYRRLITHCEKLNQEPSWIWSSPVLGSALSGVYRRVVRRHAMDEYAHFKLEDWNTLPPRIVGDLSVTGLSLEERRRCEEIYNAKCLYLPKKLYADVAHSLVVAYAQAEQVPEQGADTFARVYCSLAPVKDEEVVFPLVCRNNCETRLERLLVQARETTQNYQAIIAEVTRRNWRRICDSAFVESVYETYEVFLQVLKQAMTVAFALFFLTGLIYLMNLAMSAIFGKKKSKPQKLNPKLLYENADGTTRKPLDALGKPLTFKFTDDKQVQLVTTGEAEVSGDAKTRSAPKRAQAEASGDNKTKAAVKRATVELAPTSFTEVSEVGLSGSRKLGKGRPDAVRESLDSALEVERAEATALLDENARSLLTTIIRNNMVSIQFRREDSFEDEAADIRGDEKWQHAITATFIRGRIAVTNKHIIFALRKQPMLRIQGAMCKDGTVVMVKDLIVLRAEDTHPLYGERDVCLIVFPRHIRQHRDIIKHFIDRVDVQNFREVRKAMLVGYLPAAELICGIYVTDKCVGMDKQLIMTYKGKDISSVRRFFKYNIETTQGDCGALLMSMSMEHQRKICGIHCAGRVDTEYCGMASPVSQEHIQFLLQLALKHNDVIVADALICCPELDVESDLVEVIEMDPPVRSFQFEAKVSGNRFGGAFMDFGVIQDPVVQYNKTELRKSPLYGKIEGHPSTTAPARLNRFRSVLNNQIIDPMTKAILKADVNPVSVPSRPLDIAVLDVRNMVNSRKSNYRRVLSYEEAISGVEGDPYLGAISRRSSPGYPWIHQKTKSGCRGKEEWLGVDEKFVYDHPKLLRALHDRETAASDGKRVPTLWVDVLKDERRPHLKVEMGKTRLFSCGPMDFNILFRKYFLGFCAHMMENRILFESCVGVNVYSMEWNQIAQELTNRAGPVIAADFTNYDGTLNAGILWSILDLINDWYDDGHDLIRKVLWSDIVNSNHLCGDFAYGWCQSQPSGNPMTVIVNSIYNSIALRMVWLIIMADLRPELSSMRAFHEHTRTQNYGDDFLVSLTGEASECFHFDNMQDVYRELGMVITDELKSEVPLPLEDRAISDVSFLKRKFRYDADMCRYMAPLAMDTIMDMPQWVRGPHDHQSLTKDNVETAAYELAQYPEEIFLQQVNKLKKASEVLCERPVFETFYTYRVLDAYKYQQLAIGYQNSERGCFEMTEIEAAAKPDSE